MLNDDEKQIVKYLRMSPRDSLKRDAADLIEKIAAQNGNEDAARYMFEMRLDYNTYLKMGLGKISFEEYKAKSDASTDEDMAKS